jgi:hypothetical protein
LPFDPSVDFRSMTTKKTALVTASIIATGALVLSACGGSSDSGETTAPAPSPTSTDSDNIGGGEAECTTGALEMATEGAAAADGVELINTNEYDCVDGWAIVFAVTKEADIEQTTAYVFEAEGPMWVRVDLASICDGDADVPDSIEEQACALR